MPPPLDVIAVPRIQFWIYATLSVLLFVADLTLLVRLLTKVRRSSRQEMTKRE